MEKTQHDVIKGGSFLIDHVLPEHVFTPEDFTEEQQMIAKMTEEFVVNEIVPKLDQIEEHQFDISRQLLNEAGELGLLSSDIPEQYGGLGLDKISSALISEKFARARAFSITHGAHVGIGTLPIVFFGTKEQKERYLPDLASGRKIAAYALTEPGSGSDALGAKTTAVLNDEGTHYRLNGEKQWITNSAFADVFIVYAKVDGEHFTAFIVERTFDGVSTGPEEKKMGIKGSSTRTLILDDVAVPKENVLGEIGKGHVIAFNILNIGRFKLATGCVGASKRAIELAASYATERKQFKQPIANFSLIQEKLASMAVQTYALESSVYRTGGLFDRAFQQLSEEEKEDGRKVALAIAEYAIECSVNKFFGSEVLDDVVDEALQIHGGYGFMAEYEIETMYRDARINRIFEGTNEINRLLVPNTLLKKAMSGDLPLLEKARALQEEMMTMTAEGDFTKPLEKEKNMMEKAKKVGLMVVGLAAQTYGKKLAFEQEILASVADIVSDIYALESCVLRTEKAMHASSGDQQRQKILYTEVFVEEAMNRIEAHAKKSLMAIQSGDSLRMSLSALRRLTRRDPINVIAKKRAIAQNIVAKKSYIV